MPVKKLTSSKKMRFSISFISSEEKEYFIDNLSMLLTSGMDISTALTNIGGEVRSAGLKKIIGQLQENIAGGSSLWEALEDTHLLPKHIIALVRVAEQSGRLDESLGVIVTQQEKNRLFKSKIRAAMIYPVLVLMVATIVGVSIAWFILPRLAIVFKQLNLALPLITRLLIGLGTFLASYGSVAVPGFIITLIVIFYFIFVFEKTKVIGQIILFHVPGIKKLIQQIELSRFGFIMGTLLQGGLPVTDALDALKEATPLKKYKKIYENLGILIAEGYSFEESFRRIKHSRRYLPLAVQGLIAAGEQSGRLAKTFTSIANVYESKTEITTKNLSVILEPLMLVIVWLGVVGVALAVILPIYSLVGNLNNPPAPGKQTVPSTYQVPPLRSTTAVSSTFHISTTTTSVIVSTASSFIATSTASVFSSFTTTTLQVLPGNPRVRVLPNTRTDIITRLASSTVVTAIDLQNGWYKIILNDNQVGWIKGNYVTTISSSTAP